MSTARSRRLDIRKLAVPGAIALTGVALVAALAAGPVLRSLSDDGDAAVEVSRLVEKPAVAAAAVEPVALPAPVAQKPATASRVAAAASSQVGTEVLGASDPRWANAEMPTRSAALAQLKKAVEETVAAADGAFSAGSDDIRTAAIPARANAYFSSGEPEGSAQDDAFAAALGGVKQPEEAGRDLSPAKATQYVNMRSAPSDDARVLTVVPANAAIEAETDCRWCQVSYNGQTGYVYQSFITR